MKRKLETLVEEKADLRRSLLSAERKLKRMRGSVDQLLTRITEANLLTEELRTRLDLYAGEVLFHHSIIVR